MNSVTVRLQSRVLVEAARQHAERLSCSPQKLCLAIVAIVLRSDLVGGILDGDTPDDICGRGVNPCAWPMGTRQKRVLDHIAAGADSEGNFCGSYDEIGAATGIASKGEIATVMRKLRRRGEIEQVRKGTNGKPSIWRVVRDER
ncbi:MAG: hypothetical protein QMD99_03985 [Rhizobiaceae bacterium]|nr:hypothetical protein [Rhizobiaceae bacterium]